jgi:hypothetical protein
MGARAISFAAVLVAVAPSAACDSRVERARPFHDAAPEPERVRGPDGCPIGMSPVPGVFACAELPPSCSFDATDPLWCETHRTPFHCTTFACEGDVLTDPFRPREGCVAIATAREVGDFVERRICARSSAADVYVMTRAQKGEDDARCAAILHDVAARSPLTQ